MANPILVPCLRQLRAEFNRLNPDRDKRSDGWLGDRAHALRSSDHNPDETGATPYEDADFVDEVHAIDVDETGPWPEGFDVYVERVRLNHYYGRDDRLQNIIRNRRVASRSWGWDWRPYTGSNPHTEHAHFSARYVTAAEADMSPWGLEGDDVTPQDIEDVADRVLVKLTEALQTAATPETDDDSAIVRNLRRIPWQYPGALEQVNRLDEIEAGVAKLVAGMPAAAVKKAEAAAEH